MRLKFKEFLNNLKEGITNQLGALSASEMGFTLTVGVLVGAAVTITGNVKQLDSVESIHLYNAQTLGQGAQTMIDSRKIDGPSVGGSITITMSQLMAEGLLPSEGVPDPSTVSSNYLIDDTVVMVLNEAGATDAGSELRFYSKLVGTNSSTVSGKYSYVDETSVDKDGEQAQSNQLTLDNIFLPERSVSAETARQL